MIPLLVESAEKTGTFASLSKSDFESLLLTFNTLNNLSNLKFAHSILFNFLLSGLSAFPTLHQKYFVLITC